MNRAIILTITALSLLFGSKAYAQEFDIQNPHNGSFSEVTYKEYAGGSIWYANLHKDDGSTVLVTVKTKDLNTGGVVILRNAPVVYETFEDHSYRVQQGDYMLSASELEYHPPFNVQNPRHGTLVNVTPVTGDDGYFSWRAELHKDDGLMVMVHINAQDLNTLEDVTPVDGSVIYEGFEDRSYRIGQNDSIMSAREWSTAFKAYVTIVAN